jgi:hypothetical protein
MCVLLLPPAATYTLQGSARGGPAETATATGSPATAAAGPCNPANPVPEVDQTADHHLDLPNPADPHAHVAPHPHPGGPLADLLDPPVRLNPQRRPNPPARPNRPARPGHPAHRDHRRDHLDLPGRPPGRDQATPLVETAPLQALDPAAQALNLGAQALAHGPSPRGHLRGRHDRQILITLGIMTIRQSRIGPATLLFHLRHGGRTSVLSRCRRCLGRARFSTR